MGHKYSIPLYEDGLVKVKDARRLLDPESEFLKGALSIHETKSPPTACRPLFTVCMNNNAGESELELRTMLCD